MGSRRHQVPGWFRALICTVIVATPVVIVAVRQATRVAAAQTRADRPGAAYVAISAPGLGGLAIAAAGCHREAELVLAPYISPHSRDWCGGNQAWTFQRLSSGYDSIDATYGGRSECIAAVGSYRTGTRLEARPCDPSRPGPRQRFRPSQRTHGDHPGTYEIGAAADQRLCLTEAGHAKMHSSSTSELDLEPCAGNMRSAWAIPDAPTHTETWAFDDSAHVGRCNGGDGASSYLVREWLTYAETNCGPGNTKALRDCRTRGVSYCTVIQYFNANKLWTDNPILSAPTHEHWWLHEPGFTDAAHRLTDSSPAWGHARWLNQTNPAAQRWIADYVRSHYNAWDGLLMDNTGASLKAQLYRSDVPADQQYTSSQELTTNRAVVEEHEALARVLKHANGAAFDQVDNGVSPNPFLPNALTLLDHPASVVGLISEGSPWDYGFSPYYSNLLDLMAAVDARLGDFIVLLSYDGDGSQQARLVQEATVLLGYEPGHVVSWADLEQRNLDLSVWPEEGIYPTKPIQSMTPPRGPGCLAGTGAPCVNGGHNDLRIAPGFSPTDRGGGVYRREFRDCYDRGVWFGRCAAIVNDTSRSVTVRGSWLRQSYRHVITVRGGDVQSGGTLDLKGAIFTPGVTSIPADDALLLAQ